MELSKHFTLEEFTNSPTAVYKKIDNTPNKEQIENMKALCLNVLEPIREKLGKPVKVTSGFRCPKLNSLIGGSSTSQHMEGKAADIHVEGMTTEELFVFVCSNFKFDQCIQEFDSWVHISYDSPLRNSRLRAVKVKKGKGFTTKYLPA